MIFSIFFLKNKVFLGLFIMIWGVVNKKSLASFADTRE